MLDSYPNRWWKLNVGHFRVLLLIPGFHLSSKGFFFFFLCYGNRRHLVLYYHLIISTNLIYVSQFTQVTARSSIILLAKRSGSFSVLPLFLTAVPGDSVRPRPYLHTSCSYFHIGFCFLSRLSWKARHRPCSSLI